MTGKAPRRALGDALADRRGARALVTALLAALLAVALGGGHRGFDATVVAMSTGSVWLASADRGELTLLDTTSPAVVRHLSVAAPGEPLAVGQGPTAYGLNGATGVLSRVDGRTFTATTASGVLTRPGNQPMLLAARSSLYALDVANGEARRIDTTTFTPLEAIDLPTQPPDGGVDVDDTGRVWLTDVASRDVTWFADGTRGRLPDAAPAPGAVIDSTHDGPVLVSGAAGTVQQLTDSGAVRKTAYLPVRGDRIAVTAENSDVVDIVIGSSGVLVQCSLETETCTGPITLGSGADLLGRPVAADGLVFVPDHARGQVIVVDPRQGAVVAAANAVSRAGPFELFVHDDVVVFNDPSGPDAGVIDADGTVHRVDKHARTAADPGAGPPPAVPSPPPSTPPPTVPPSPPATSPRTPTPVGPAPVAPVRAAPPASAARPTGDVDRRASAVFTTTPDSPARTRAAAPSTEASTSGPPSTTRSATTTRSTAPTTSAAPQGGTCDELSSGAALVDVDLTPDGRRSGLTFCPVLINNGHLPITGQFPVVGQVLGLEAGQPIMIVDYGDQNTCDALGNRAVDGTFAQDVTFESSTGRWSFTEDLGYPESVTIARTFEYITASAASLAVIRKDKANWSAAHDGDSQGYPGMKRLPPDTKVLASFDTPAGEFPGAKPCSSG